MSNTVMTDHTTTTDGSLSVTFDLTPPTGAELASVWDGFERFTAGGPDRSFHYYVTIRQRAVADHIVFGSKYCAADSIRRVLAAQMILDGLNQAQTMDMQAIRAKLGTGVAA